jgi:hypothetical protein
MMQSEHPLFGNKDCIRRLVNDFPSFWGVQIPKRMRSVVIVILHVFNHQLLEMIDGQRNHMICKILTNSPYKSFSDSILPRTERSCNTEQTIQHRHSEYVFHLTEAQYKIQFSTHEKLQRPHPSQSMALF